jgi:mxaJ protein
MCSRFPERVLAVAAAVSMMGGAALAAEPLRVCVDPDRLPYSQNDHHGGRGFEVEVARVLAGAMQRSLQLEWQPMVRGTVRKTLKANVCDVLMGVPAGFEMTLNTQPYYRSGYVIVTRHDDPRPLRSFDDPRLPALHVGVELIGNDLAASPPGYALARRGAVHHVEGFTLFNDTVPIGQRMVDAVAQGRLDAALLWGPQAGWFAQHAPVDVTPAKAPDDLQKMPFEFGIALGVRKGDRALRDALQAALDASKPQVDAVLAAYGVPRTDAGAGKLAEAAR